MRLGQHSPRPNAAVEWEKLEKSYCAFEGARDAGVIVRRGRFRWTAKDLFSQLYPDSDPTEFRFSASWFRRFLGR